jgi:hypothetical protein
MHALSLLVSEWKERRVELVLNPKACCLQVAPVKSQLSNAAEQMQVTLAPHSFTAFDLALAEPKLVAEI